MKDRIKKLYQEAGELHKQATDILNEFDGKTLPAEKQTQVDNLLNDVEAKTAEAKRLERAADIGRELSEPTNRLGAGQPDLSVPGEAAVDVKASAYQAAFKTYLRYGAARLSADEVKALSAGDDQAGGYLVRDQYRTELITKQREMSAMRRICRVLPAIPGGSSITPAQENDLSDATWTTEILTGAADAVKPFGRRILTPHPLAKRIKVSNTLLRSTDFNVETWVRDEMAYKFAVPEENAFVNGTGAGQPLGILNTVGLPTFTTAGSLDVTGDDIINWLYSLPARYAPRARVLCNRAFIRKARTLKGTDNNYLWQPGLSAGSPNVILDVPYEFSDRVDDGLSAADAWEADAVVAVVGDFSYYWIVDSLNLGIQRVSELYAETNETGFIGRKESDGMTVLAEAFYAMKIKA